MIMEYVCCDNLYGIVINRTTEGSFTFDSFYVTYAGEPIIVGQKIMDKIMNVLIEAKKGEHKTL